MDLKNETELLECGSEATKMRTVVQWVMQDVVPASKKKVLIILVLCKAFGDACQGRESLTSC